MKWELLLRLTSSWSESKTSQHLSMELLILVYSVLESGRGFTCLLKISIRTKKEVTTTMERLTVESHHYLELLQADSLDLKVSTKGVNTITWEETFDCIKYWKLSRVVMDTAHVIGSTFSFEVSFYFLRSWDLYYFIPLRPPDWLMATKSRISITARRMIFTTDMPITNVWRKLNASQIASSWAGFPLHTEPIVAHHTISNTNKAAFK